MKDLKRQLTELIIQTADEISRESGIEEVAHMLDIEWKDRTGEDILADVSTALAKWDLERLGELLLGHEHRLVRAWETETDSIYLEMEQNYSGSVL